MTLLFFIRSPAGNTDVGAAPDGATHWDREEIGPKRKKRDKQLEREERKAKRLAKKKWDEAINDALVAEQRRRKKKRDEELLMMLFMHEFDGYDD